MNAPLPGETRDRLYLARLGERVRAWRHGQGMTRKALAELSQVSERYLAQLEAGYGNISVLLLRLTEKRFSATQYALFSSLFALPRVLSGPVAGFAVDAIGWGPYYLATMLVGIPGLVMLGRFVPLGVREPDFTSATLVDEDAPGSETTRVAATSGLTARGVAAGIVSALGGSFVLALMAVLQSRRGKAEHALELSTAWRHIWLPGDLGGWLQLLSIVAFAGACGMVAVAAQAARRRRAP